MSATAVTVAGAAALAVAAVAVLRGSIGSGVEDTNGSETVGELGVHGTSTVGVLPLRPAICSVTWLASHSCKAEPLRFVLVTDGDNDNEVAAPGIDDTEEADAGIDTSKLGDRCCISLSTGCWGSGDRAAA